MKRAEVRKGLDQAEYKFYFISSKMLEFSFFLSFLGITLDFKDVTTRFAPFGTAVFGLGCFILTGFLALEGGAIFFNPLFTARVLAAMASFLTDFNAVLTAGSFKAFLPALKIVGIIGFSQRKREAKSPPIPLPR